ncbi:MAG: fasciclin domain-containing protein [Chitinophagaceae bacterium]|nr:fasciclin domain-containing protein [Chitinophagaceae bacterium]
MIRYLFITAATMLLLSACKHDEILLNKPTNNQDVRSLGGYISNNYDYTLFAAALEYTGLLDTLTHATGPFTVLAPANDAFNAIGIQRPADFLAMDRDSLRFIIASHILPYRVLEEDIPLDELSTPYETLSGTALEAYRVSWPAAYADQSVSKLVSFSGAEIKKTDISEITSPNYSNTELSNGVMHTLNKIIKIYPSSTVQGWLETRPQYSIFVSALKKFNLWNDLSGQGPFTVFAPANDIFEGFGLTADSLAAMDAGRYNGAKLFGSYIMYGKRFLISDYYFFYCTQKQGYYMDTLRNAPGFHRFFMGAAYFFSQDDYLGNIINFGIRNTNVQWTYSVGITAEDKPWGYGRVTQGTSDISVADQMAFLGGNNYFFPVNASWTKGLPTGMDIHSNDNICTNGIVHRFHALTVLPEEAIK